MHRKDAIDVAHPRRQEAQEILAAASAVLGHSLDLRETAEAIARAAIPRFADWAVVDGLDEEGRFGRLALAHADPAQLVAAAALDRRWPPDFEQRAGTHAVLTTGEPMLLGDLRDEDFAPLARDAEHLAAWRAFRVRSCVAVPLETAGERLGVLTLLAAEGRRRYTAEDLPLALELGRRGAIALVNAHLFARERRAHAETAAARDRTERLQRLSAELTRSLTPDEVVDVVVRHLVTALGALAAGVFELSADGAEFRMLGSTGVDSSLRERVARLPVDSPYPIGEVARTRVPVLIEDTATWRAAHPGVPVMPGDGVRAWAALPLRVEERLLGALTVTLAGPRTFAAEERGFLQAFADLCAQALERARLFDAERTARAALAESEQQFRLLADAIPILAWTARPDGSVDWYNARWYEYTGATAAQSLGWGGRAVYDPRELPRVLAAWRASIADGREFEMVHSLRRRDGVFRQFLTRVVPVRDAGGAVVRWCGTNTDIEAERARAAAEAARAEAEAARAVAEAESRAKDELLAVVSHELRAPLAPARALAQVLAHADALAPELRAMAAEIDRHIAYEARLIGDLLEYERATRGLLGMRPQGCDVHEVVRRALRLAGHAFQAKGMPVREDLAATDPSVWADPIRVKEILYNLLANAAKFSPEGAPVVVRTRNPVPGWVEMTVVDNGVGIAPEHLPHLFEPFAHVGALTQVGDRPSPPSGLGLGLALSRQLAEAQGGTLTAASEGRGCGATFALRLPTAHATGTAKEIAPNAAAPGGAAAGAAGAAAEPALRILVIEDDASAAHALRRLLATHGHVVHLADSLAGAERIAGAEPLDVVLTDLRLGEESGLDAPRRLTQVTRQVGRPTPPAIVLSGYDRESDVAESRAAGFVAHLAKPVDELALFQALRRAVSDAAP